MWKYATRRVLTMIPILIGVSMVVFLLVASLPGDAVDAHAGGNITAEKIAQNKALLGLDKPIPERYVNWASHAIRGDFGISISYKIPVTEVIGKFVWNSFLVAAVAFILQLLIAIPIGVISATKQYSIFDNTFSVVAFAGIARKNVKSAAAVLDTPSASAPMIVAPEREVPGIIASIWNTPIQIRTGTPIWEILVI